VYSNAKGQLPTFHGWLVISRISSFGSDATIGWLTGSLLISDIPRLAMFLEAFRSACN